MLIKPGNFGKQCQQWDWTKWNHTLEQRKLSELTRVNLYVLHCWWSDDYLVPWSNWFLWKNGQQREDCYRGLLGWNLSKKSLWWSKLVISKCSDLQVLNLIPLAESVTKLNAVCMLCYKDAAFTKRLGSETQVEVIGGAEKYISVCRQCFIEPVAQHSQLNLVPAQSTPKKAKTPLNMSVEIEATVVH